MKALKSVFFCILICFAGLSELLAQQGFKPAVGLAFKTSTNGFGGDVIYNFHYKLGIRLGFETLGVNSNISFKEQDVAYSARVNFRAGSISLLFDYYLANKIFLTGGAGWNLFHALVDGKADGSLPFGDIQIPKEKIGTFNFRIDPSMRISPYLGIGFGHTLGLKKKVGFAFELGGYYQGAPDISILATGLLSPTSNPDQKQAAKLEKQINQYSIYPVLKLSLSYKIISIN